MSGPTVRMKALRSFLGDEGPQKTGREFNAHAGNVDGYERHEPPLAVRVLGKGDRFAKVEPTLKNKAAETGPFGSRGGVTGEAEPPRLSPQGRPRQPRASKGSKAAAE